MRAALIDAIKKLFLHVPANTTNPKASSANRSIMFDSSQSAANKSLNVTKRSPLSPTDDQETLTRLDEKVTAGVLSVPRSMR